jgi:hypothetical protein
MAAKLTRLTHKIAIQLHLVAEIRRTWTIFEKHDELSFVHTERRWKLQVCSFPFVSSWDERQPLGVSILSGPFVGSSPENHASSQCRNELTPWNRILVEKLTVNVRARPTFFKLTDCIWWLVIRSNLFAPVHYGIQSDVQQITSQRNLDWLLTLLKIDIK